MFHLRKRTETNIRSEMGSRLKITIDLGTNRGSHIWNRKAYKSIMFYQLKRTETNLRSENVFPLEKLESFRK
jgi:hypothetical protein